MASAIPALIHTIEAGDSSASATLFTVLYSELHRLAKREVARQSGAVTLSPTTLLHEAYIDMAGRDGRSFPDKGRFMAYAARVMRGLIIDHVRMRRAQKRGSQFDLTSLTTEVGESIADHRELTRISDLLDELAETDPALAQIVDLKFFCGFSFAEIAAMHGLSERSVQRRWDKARIYLHSRMRAA